MQGSHWRGGWVAMGLVLVGAVGCGHVSREDFDATIDQVRQEMRQGDETVESTLAQRIQTLETRVDTRLAALETGLRSLESEFEVTVERLETAIRFNAPVHFAFDDATVREVDHPILDRFAGVVQEYYDGATITVEGFTDPAGSAEYNRRLGMTRAEAVRDYLTGAGIPADRIRAVSYGADQNRQIAEGARGPGERGWQNRRVAMVVDFGTMAQAPMAAPAIEGQDP